MRILGFDIKRAPTPADLLAQEQARKIEARSGFDLWAEQLQSLGLGFNTQSGVRNLTEETALAVSAVFACVRLLSQSVASLPCKLYRRDGRARIPASEHPVYRLVHDQGNAVMTAMQLREVMMVHLALWGNFYGEKQYDRAGRVVGVWPIMPGRVQPYMSTTAGAPSMHFRVSTPEGVRSFDSEKILHIAAFSKGGYVGRSPIDYAREAIGIATAAEQYAARFYSQDGRSRLYFSTPNHLSDNAYERLKAELTKDAGGAQNAWRIKILEEGLKPENVDMPIADAMFISARKFQVEEVARIYNVPPHMIQDLSRSTYSNIEHQGLSFVIHTLRPWLVRIEQALKRDLLSPEEQADYYIEHVVDGLLRGDTAARFDAYTKGRNWGWLSANDVRELENMNPIDEGGDDYLVPLNMVPAGTERDEIDPFRESPVQSERRSARTRYNLSVSLEPVYRDALRRIIKREVADVRQALTRYLEAGDVEAFGDWLDTFFASHAEWIKPKVRPAFRAMAEAMVAAAQDEVGGDASSDEIDQFLSDYIDAFASRHAGKSRGQIRALLDEEDPHGAVATRLDEWEESRADKEARRERERSANAFTKAAWAAVGITAVTWRAVGESCPICTEMDGRTAVISGSFLNAGQTVGDLTASSPIGHPPLHDGCTCQLEAHTIRRSPRSGEELRDVLSSILLNDGDLSHHRCEHA